MEEQPENDQLLLFAGEANSTPRTLSAQQAAFLALVDIRGVGEATLRSILKGFPDIPAVFTSDQAHLAAMLADVGVRRSTAVATEVSKRRDFRSAAEPLAERLRRQGVSLILDDDPRFPARLRNIKDPPRWVFVEGTPEVISRTDAVAVVGTRQAGSVWNKMEPRD